MNREKRWGLFLFNLAVWLLAISVLWLPFFYYNSAYGRILFHFDGFGDILLICLISALIFTLIYSNLTLFTKAAPQIPPKAGIAQNLLVFIIVFLDLLFSSFFGFNSMETSFAVFFLIINALLIIGNHISIIRKNERTPNIKQIITRPIPIMLKVITTILIVSLHLLGISDEITLVYWIYPLLAGSILYVCIHTLLPNEKRGFDVMEFLVLMIYSYAFYFFSRMISYFIFDEGFIVGRLPVLLALGLLNSAMVLIRLNYSNVILSPKSSTGYAKEGGPRANIPQVPNGGHTTERNTFPVLTCPHCKTGLDLMDIDAVNPNVVIFCPHCGQKILRNDKIPTDKKELLHEHERILAQICKDPVLHTNMESDSSP